MLMSLRSDERRSNNISDVRPSSRRQREYTVYLVGNCRILCLSVNQLSSNPTVPSVHPQLPPGEPQHVGHGQRGQWLLPHRGALHTARVPVHHHLGSFERLVCSKILALARLRGQMVFVASDMQRRHSFGLVRWLRTEHCCVKLLVLGESRTSENHLVFLGSFQLGCNLGHVGVCLPDEYTSPGT
ncbi:hypothetical protein MTO96_013797 [Rhipicephalus appendiculatus]